jgi:hypothetical protein
MFARRAIIAPLVIAAMLGLSACGGGEGDDVVYRYPDSTGQAQTPTDDGGMFDGLFGSTAPAPGTADPGVEVKTGAGVNSYLWRASLDTLSFMPLASADPFGGTIITDWYSAPETPNEQFKVTVYILDKELRADGVRVAVFRQQRDPAGQWANAGVPQDTATKLENAILTRARQLRVATVEE